jgi:DNA (cytosine-5)-methyltransferase 1
MYQFGAPDLGRSMPCELRTTAAFPARGQNRYRLQASVLFGLLAGILRRSTNVGREGLSGYRTLLMDPKSKPGCRNREPTRTQEAAQHTADVCYDAVLRTSITGSGLLVDIDLFAGAGGLAIGLERAGFARTAMYEKDKYACRTLRRNITSDTPTLKGTVQETEVEKVEWRPGHQRVRLLAAGAPCQPFSLGGKHLAEQDGRNLFPEVFRAVRELQPKAVLLENVRGLARPSFRPYFDYILRQLRFPSIKPKHDELWEEHNARIMAHDSSTKHGPEYHVSWAPFDAADFGVPQNRRRVFIVGTQPDFPIYQFPKRTHSKEALLRALSNGVYWERHGLQKPKNGNLNAPPFEDDGTIPWKTVRDALADLPAPADSQEEAEMNHWIVLGARAYVGHAGSRLDWPAKTIKAGVHGVPGGENILVSDRGEVRYFTIRETARLQTFPDKHHFEGARLHATRQIGNAVPCDLAEAIGAPLFKLLRRKERAR